MLVEVHVDDAAQQAMIVMDDVYEPFVGKLMAQQAIFDALGTIVEPEHLQRPGNLAAHVGLNGVGQHGVIGAIIGEHDFG